MKDIAGWITIYPKIPINFMRKIHGVPVSIRKLNRIKEIETIPVTYKNETVHITSLPELTRLKCMAILSRSLIKDYIDLLKLHEKHNIVPVIQTLDEFYAGNPTRVMIEKLVNPVFQSNGHDNIPTKSPLSERELRIQLQQLAQLL